MKPINGLLPLCLVAALALPVQASSPMGPKNIPQRGDIPVQQYALAFFLQRFQADLASTEHTYDINAGRQREAALRNLYQGWLARLGEFEYAKLTLEDQIDHALLKRELNYRLSQLDFERTRADQALELLPGIAPLIDLAEQRRALKPLQPEQAKRLISEAGEALQKKQAALGKQDGVSPVVALRAAKLLQGFREEFKDWHTFYNGYDPSYTASISKPYEALDKQLENYGQFLRNELAGAKNPEAIIGDPIGRDAVEAALRYEMIPYSPEQIVQLAERELAWCQAEMGKAAADMGFSDWQKALEKIKQDGPPLGGQPQYVVKLADEAIDFVESNDLVSVPALAKRDWRMTMLTPEYQLQAPFFLGGEDVWVAYPHDSMPAEKQAMALRGNNRYFSRAVVHHELIPGHHLQHFYNTRYNTQRQLFDTPFWGEGWALYWEFLLYQKGFAATPEQKLGMLFWRSHRAARILFSLSFHMGTMKPQQAIDLLVSRVGHERENAAAEVRRSFAGDYSPIYQAAYMLGGLQFWALRQELVESGKMTDRAFHDRILKGGPMPVSVVRSRLLEQAPDKDLKAEWRFYPALNQP
ncbi:MAG TPA: DUF885 domain-containing protein [Arenimonas sp.]|nr:DUF885 domain-containing protein [Arenimonas sp.]